MTQRNSFKRLAIQTIAHCTASLPYLQRQKSNGIPIKFLHPSVATPVEKIPPFSDIIDFFSTKN